MKLHHRRFLRIPEVCNHVGFGKSQIYALMARGEFPQSIKLSPRVTVWREDEVLAWIDRRTVAAHTQAGGSPDLAQRHAIVEAVQAFFEEHAEARFRELGANCDGNVSANPLGWRVNFQGRRAYVITEGVFRYKLCAGQESSQVEQALRECDVLLAEGGDPARLGDGVAEIAGGENVLVIDADALRKVALRRRVKSRRETC